MDEVEFIDYSVVDGVLYTYRVLAFRSEGSFKSRPSEEESASTESKVLGFYDVNGNILLTVYPNPVVNQVIIESPIAISEITVLDINGGLVKVIINENKVSLAENNSGTYMLLIKDVAGNSYSEKVIKQ